MQEQWETTTPDDAARMLHTWISGIDDPQELARLLLVVCGCQRVAVNDSEGTISYVK
jgi:hypothetical protein